MVAQCGCTVWLLSVVAQFGCGSLGASKVLDPLSSSDGQVEK